ncbi:MAG: 4-hydroxy-tetrahydrodipicolinate reductase [Lachnospiraceae bacterium]|nr:4-hydroxy-tetrahydrodipicolinate reductase [Lachnospiraceae bacterium]
MTRVIMHGCNGRMGRTITAMIDEMDDVEIVAGVDAFDDGHNQYPVFSNIADCRVDADVIIDFSNVVALDGLLDECVDRGIPLVLCTTGLSDDQISKLRVCSTKVAILMSANMSLGINLLMKLLKEATAVLDPAGFDIEIVEKHHNRKLDAPSGTAYALANAINDALPEKYQYVYDRTGRRMKRPKEEIGISAIRGGSIVGDHDVIFAGQDEVITFSHRAYSRAVFARGAISAAQFLVGKAPGLYNMSDVIG